MALVWKLQAEEIILYQNCQNIYTNTNEVRKYFIDKFLKLKIYVRIGKIIMYIGKQRLTSN